MNQLKKETLADLLAAFIEHRRSLNLSDVSNQVVHNNVKRFLKWLVDGFAITTPDRLRDDHLQRWQSQLGQQTNRKGLPLKPRTVNKNLESVRTFVSWLADRHFVPDRLRDVLQYVKTPKLLPSSVLTHAQVKRMLKRIDTTNPAGHRNRTLLELLYSTGLRAAEVLGLDVADIDLDHRTAIVTGKGNKQRIVPLGQTALRYVESYLKAVRPFLLRSNKNEAAVFLTEQGNRYPYHTLNRMIAKAASVLDVDFPVTPHTFRRSCTTEMVRGGANLYHVKELLGHESLETLKHYTKLTITDLQKTHAKCHPREREDR